MSKKRMSAYFDCAQHRLWRASCRHQLFRIKTGPGPST